MAKKKSKKEELFYVGVKNPVELRRVILESSKEMVQYMQRAEKFKKTRAEKEEEFAKLKKTMNSVSSMVSKLRTYLPKADIKSGASEYKKAKKDAPSIKNIKVSKQSLKEIPQSEIIKLERELGEIESRIKRMS